MNRAADVLLKNDWLESLRQRLNALDLPGRFAQRRYSPNWAYGRHFGPIMGDHQRAAVVIFVYPSCDGWSFPLTKRPPTLPDHPGQISLPGGRIEAGESIEQAALRELSEELGIDVAPQCILGRLSPLFVYSSGYHVTPIVACGNELPQWQASAEEVDRILEVPLEALSALAKPVPARLVRGNVELSFPAWHFADEVVWGATAMILSEFRELVFPSASGI
jgi:8-oxo-dGTP pyrophosphatase MutT (NUDIX family)